MVKNVYYVPAGMEGLISSKRIDPKSLNTDYVLINVTGIGTEKSLKHYENMYKILKENNKMVIADSGGFQIATGVLNYRNPRDVILYQNKVSDIGFILDVPPFRKTSDSSGASSLIFDSSQDFFLECKEKTKENIKIGRSIKKEMEYYFILQGATYEQLKIWYDDLIHEDIFDGIATKGATKEQLLLGLMFIENTPFLKHHILGISNLFGQVIISYFYEKSIKNMKRVTFDSTSALINSCNKKLIVPFNSCQIAISRYNNFCDIEGYDFETLKTNSYKFHVLNINQLQKQHKIVTSLVSNKEELKKFIQNKTIIEYLEVIDYFFKNNTSIEKTIDKYPNIFKTKIFKTTKQNSLFN